MADTVMYGEMDSEKQANENNVARNIVLEISKFGVNERQKLLIIHLLAMELENSEHMREIVSLVKELSDEAPLFLATDAEA